MISFKSGQEMKHLITGKGLFCGVCDNDMLNDRYSKRFVLVCPESINQSKAHINKQRRVTIICEKCIKPKEPHHFLSHLSPEDIKITHHYYKFGCPNCDWSEIKLPTKCKLTLKEN